jgi:RND superfamily putative drug exporter
VRDTVPALERTLAAQIHSPVTATQTGYASLSRAIQQESVNATRTAELIAIPFLLLVLLAVFRSPLAAAIPLAFGAITLTASRGVLALAASEVAVDGFALTVCSMMGLALGVDYALLMVSRFREELRGGADPTQAAQRTRHTAGRTTAFAGATLLLAMVVILAVMPGTLLLSLAGTAIVVTAISVAVAALLAPPLLALLGHNVNRWTLGKSSDGARLMVAVSAALARPRLAAALIGAALLLLAAPVLALKTGPPSAAQLPESNPARQDAETIAREIGPGWDAPFVLVAAAKEGTIASDGRLAALGRWQRRIAADPGVQAVIGPAQVQRRLVPLRDAGNDLLAGKGEASPARLQRLGDGIARAATGVGQLRGGIAEASYGAALLATGSGRAGEGAERLRGGIERLGEGAVRATDALGRLGDGSGRLAEGQRRSQLATRSLTQEIADARARLQKQSLARARRLSSELDARAAADPSLQAAATRAANLVVAIAASRNELKSLHSTSSTLYSAQQRLTDGSIQLHSGAERLAGAAGRLPEGLQRLGAGSGALRDGLERLRGGAETLGAGLASGFERSGPLQGGLRRAGVRVSSGAADLERRVSNLRSSSPGIFDSGYFVLSALDGAPPTERERAAEILDIDAGGQAAQLLVIPRYTFNTPGSIALGERLGEDARALAAATGMQAELSGGAAQLADYTGAISRRIPLLIAAITLATFLVLVVILRALILAALAVALNLITVAVAFGVLTLLFEVPAGWPLGGRDYVDAIGAAGIFGIVFGLSIDYAVFLLARMRESYEQGASNEEAIAYGLARTARVITGAAAIMMAVFIAFAGAPIATVSQLGVGLAVAVLLDATVIRIVLLPALMLIIGEAVWWLPRPLERLLPRIELHRDPRPV